MKTQKQKLADIDSALSVTQLALSDVLSGAAKPIGRPLRDGFQLWISRPNGAAGGIVVIREGGTVIACYFEQALRDQMQRFALCLTGEDNDLNRALLARRDKWEAAKAFVHQCQTFTPSAK